MKLTSNDEGDDNSNSKYWEFLYPDEVEVWSIGLVPMTNFVHFQAKFRIAEHAVVVFADKKVKDVFWYSDNTSLIHCETTGSPPYSSTICVDNLRSPFSTLYFLKSLTGSVYEPLVKEVEKEIDQKAWQTKEGLPLRARPVASKVRCLIQSMATMTVANRAMASAIMPLTISRGRGMEGASEGSTQNVLSQRLATTRAEPSPTGDSQRGQATQSHPLPLDLKESTLMCKVRLRLARPPQLPRFPPSWSLAKSLTMLKLQISTISSGQSAKAALSNSLVLLIMSPVLPPHATSIWLKARATLSLSSAFLWSSLTFFSSTPVLLAFSSKKAFLASSLSTFLCDGRLSTASSSPSGWSFPSLLHRAQIRPSRSRSLSQMSLRAWAITSKLRSSPSSGSGDFRLFTSSLAAGAFHLFSGDFFNLATSCFWIS